MFWDPKPVLRGGLDIRQISCLQHGWSWDVPWHGYPTKWDISSRVPIVNLLWKSIGLATVFGSRNSTKHQQAWFLQWFMGVSSGKSISVMVHDSHFVQLWPWVNQHCVLFVMDQPGSDHGLVFIRVHLSSKTMNWGKWNEMTILQVYKEIKNCNSSKCIRHCNCQEHLNRVQK